MLRPSRRLRAHPDSFGLCSPLLASLECTPRGDGANYDSRACCGACHVGLWCCTACFWHHLWLPTSVDRATMLRGIGIAPRPQPHTLQARPPRHGVARRSVASCWACKGVSLRSRPLRACSLCTWKEGAAARCEHHPGGAPGRVIACPSQTGSRRGFACSIACGAQYWPFRRQCRFACLWFTFNGEWLHARATVSDSL